MFPETVPEILQDASASTPRRGIQMTRISILLLSLILIIVVLLVLRNQPQVAKQPEFAGAIEPTPVPLSGTFVDRSVGTVLFEHDGQLIEYSLATRQRKEIIGVRFDETVRSFASRPIAWSADGSLLALVDDEAHVSVSEYDTGRYYGSFALREQVEASDTLTLSFAPGADILAIGYQRGAASSIQFFALQSEREIGYYPNCDSNGVWLRTVGFVTKCNTLDFTSVVLIQFEPNASSMRTIAKEPKGVSYRLIGSLDEATVYGAKQKGSSSSLLSIRIDGKIAPLQASDTKGLPERLLADPYGLLRERIEKSYGIQSVGTVSVASNDAWLAYEHDEMIYLAPMDMDSPPFVVGKGRNPSVRPL